MYTYKHVYICKSTHAHKHKHFLTNAHMADTLKIHCSTATLQHTATRTHYAV